VKIGIIGAGNIGSTLGRLWTEAGHEVLLSSRHPEALTDLAARLGERARVGTVAEAARFGDVVLLAIPYRATLALDEIRDALRGTIVIDAGNPFPGRDAEVAAAVAASGAGSGSYTAGLLPGAKVVKAFNTVHFRAMAEVRAPERRIAVPVAGAAEAVDVVCALVRDAGMEPVLLGPLEAAVRFDPGTEVWNRSMTAPELRRVLFRRDVPDGEIRIYRSEVIDETVFWHGFPERTGGLSKDRRSSLNLGYRWGDDESVVEDNRRLVAEHVGYAPEDLVVTKHVHGTAVWTVGEPLPDPPEFDGLVADRSRVVLGAFAADCVPLVFGDPSARVCGAAHAGWRGTVAGAAKNVVEAMASRGADRAAIRVALGPCIGPCCFEVGDEVVAEFHEAFGDVEGLVVPGPRRQHVDLRIANRIQLEGAGLLPAHIDSDPPCTRCHPERFFSYRRDGFLGGVHMGFIGLRS